MIKTSVVRKVSVDDVRGISHLVAVGMMTSDVFDKSGNFNYIDRYDFIDLINNYTMHCDPLTSSVEYISNDAPHKRVVIRPAGLKGIKIEYYLGGDKRITTWDVDDYMELSGEWENMPDDDEDWFE